MVEMKRQASNYFGQIVSIGSEMNRQDFSTSCVKKKRMKRHPFDLDLMLQMHFFVLISTVITPHMNG